MRTSRPIPSSARIAATLVVAVHLFANGVVAQGTGTIRGTVMLRSIKAHSSRSWRFPSAVATGMRSATSRPRRIRTRAGRGRVLAPPLTRK